MSQCSRLTGCSGVGVRRDHPNTTVLMSVVGNNRPITHILQFGLERGGGRSSLSHLRPMDGKEGTKGEGPDY